ncbi:MAG: MGMT family protein [Bacillota bacterium]
MELFFDYITTSRGNFIIVFNDSGIYKILFPGVDAGKEYQHRKLPYSQFADDLNRYLAGESVDWSKYPLDRSGYPSFTSALLEQVRQIPCGRVSNYRDVAEKAGFPRSWRAAGQAVRVNRHPILVPCHRVIKADGSLGGFSGPGDWKKELLKLEGAITSERGGG